MEEQDYIYELKPLIVPGLMFLIFYPLIVGLIFKLLNFPQFEMRVLTGIYAGAGLVIISLWVFAKSKRVRIDEEKIVFNSILGEKVIFPTDIKRIAFLRLKSGQEIARLKTKEQVYYLSEFYFPFPELMSDVEQFVRINSIRSNLESL